MRKHRFPDGVKVARFPGMSEVSGSRHVRGLGFDSRVRTLFSIDLCCIYLVFTMLFIFVKRIYSYAWCSVHGVKVARFPGMSEVSGSIPVSWLCFLLIFVVFTLCLPCYSSLLEHVQLSVVLRPRCKGSSLSRHVRGLGFDSGVRTLFSIDLCCIYQVIHVKSMYR